MTTRPRTYLGLNNFLLQNYVEKHSSLTLFDVSKRTAPSGTNITPITKKVGITLFAVITGCHAGSLCCLNAVSIKVTNK